MPPAKQTAEQINARVAEAQSQIYQLEYDRSTSKVVIEPDTWIQIGHRKNTIADETNFCEAALLDNILQLKSSLDEVNVQQIRKSRLMSNPFEVSKGEFMTRAAIKIANLDAMFDWGLCQLSDGSDSEKELLYFVDIFGGPGGCSEYILWRNGGWNAKGFGFTTKGDYEFQPEMFRVGAPETLDSFYGHNDNGNIFDPDNIRDFIDYVTQQTDNLGAHLVICDGGFYVKNNCQEIISKQLYLCLALLAVSVIRPGGNAILKVFDLYTPFSVGLVYILSKCYARISIVKPVTSRPANSERYLICQNRLNCDRTFSDYLYSINRVLWDHKHSGCDIQHIVSAEVIEKDTPFSNFIRNSNNYLARCQIKGLKKLIAATTDSYKPEPMDQKLLQSTLWRLWKLDHKSNLSSIADDKIKYAADYALQFIDSKTINLFSAPDVSINTKKSLSKLFGNPLEWNFIPVDVTANQGKSIRTIFLSKGNGNVYFFDQNEKEWQQVKGFQLILSPRTIIYGEIVEEISIKDNKQKVVNALHIIDAIMLGGVNVRSFPLSKRLDLCNKFAKALNRPLAVRNSTTVKPVPVRCKELLPMMDLDGFFNNVSINQLSSGTKVLGCDVQSCDKLESKRFYIPRGLLFVRHSQHSMAGSKMSERTLEFGKTFGSRYLWIWTKTSQIYSSAQCFDVVKEDNLVYRMDFDEFVAKFEKD
ncbi:cap-specific mRNA (nucleoside-2'-O-)-methyltransferase 1-like [Topomyia yanbarensis]|uniref:cap-specific mRNA (nucleoside-2'-O-)-methyltransferase 1-like n=1 Tax=Topomyia yanbarensis TaxID=2498891 RepID=UPI00273BEEF3|nr:cap-specific mRNA (nucleoside-2'-O-)-methyltransferase 1-like [Topomyia yanbarensis]